MTFLYQILTKNTIINLIIISICLSNNSNNNHLNFNHKILKNKMFKINSLYQSKQTTSNHIKINNNLTIKTSNNLIPILMSRQEKFTVLWFLKVQRKKKEGEEKEANLLNPLKNPLINYNLIIIKIKMTMNKTIII